MHVILRGCILCIIFVNTTSIPTAMKNIFGYPRIDRRQSDYNYRWFFRTVTYNNPNKL